MYLQTSNGYRKPTTLGINPTDDEMIDITPRDSSYMPTMSATGNHDGTGNPSHNSFTRDRELNEAEGVNFFCLFLLYQ